MKLLIDKFYARDGYFKTLKKERAIFLYSRLSGLDIEVIQTVHEISKEI